MIDMSGMIEEDTLRAKRDTILIVDDYPFNLTTVEIILSGNGFKNILTASSGAEALSLIYRNRPDLILLDIMMPGMDGFEVCNILQENEETKDIPVIMLSGKISPEDIKRGFEVGAVDYIEKPFEDPELIARVRSALKLKHARDELKSLLNDQIRSRPIEFRRLSELEATNERLRKDIEERMKECGREVEKEDYEYISNLLHDLKNPLTSLVTLLPIIHKRVTDPEVKELIETALESVNKIDEILQNTASVIKE
ncbi:MAG: response regulator [Halobacteriota archaeon]|nr:response regulator [Halobacteriota archaeon]